MKAGRCLIVSLPANDADLAAAAREGGADILKVHIRVRHAASGTTFGTLAEERMRLKRILGAFSGPVGVVTGAEDPATPEEMNDLRLMGFDFFDMYASQMPAWMWHEKVMSRVAAMEAGSSPILATLLERVGAEAVEAAIIPHDGYGKPLTVGDMALYRAICDSTKVPVIVPTQRAIRPEDAALLVGKCGVAAIMIGAIVTGTSPADIEDATGRFRAALEVDPRRED